MLDPSSLFPLPQLFSSLHLLDIWHLSSLGENVARHSLKMALPLFLFDLLYMICLSILNGALCLVFMYALTKYLLHTDRPAAPGPLSFLSCAFSRFSLFPSYKLDLQPIGPPPTEAYHAAFLISKLVPADLVPVILDKAEFWIDYPLASTSDEFFVTERNAGSSYLVAELPANFPAHGVRSLTFTITSRDQGFSWDTQFHNTYKNSWSWFEVAVSPPRPEGDSKTIEWSSVPGTRIITNSHACREYKTHDVTWSYHDDDHEVRKIVRSLRPGHKIAITVWARFPAWVNDVRSARIDCQFQAVRKM